MTAKRREQTIEEQVEAQAEDEAAKEVAANLEKSAAAKLDQRRSKGVSLLID